MTLAEDYASAMADLGECQFAVQLIGAADASRERLSDSLPPWFDEDRAELLAKTHAALPTEAWDTLYQSGRNTTIEDVLVFAHQQSVGEQFAVEGHGAGGGSTTLARASSDTWVAPS